jgi:dihydrodipicolinate synthase/N-acetylneuraminate lyase
MDAALPKHRPGRRIEGLSAVLLPFDAAGQPDLETYTALFERTLSAGLTPAANMDTGYVNLLTRDERKRVLAAASAAAGGRSFVAGAFIDGEDGDPATLYRDRVAEIRRAGGVPILFPCTALARAAESEVLAVLREVGSDGGPLLAFELGSMFAPFGRIYSSEFFGQLLGLPAFVGLKHSSLDRCLEWERLRLRDAVRPDFRLYTGNDLAIDMVFYGSDYLLGLSTFWPEAFAVRDRLWAAESARAFELNDLLQYLGFLAFRAPVPAYKHSAAQFLRLRGVIPASTTHARSPQRPASDEELLRDIAGRIGGLLETLA